MMGGFVSPQIHNNPPTELRTIDWIRLLAREVTPDESVVSFPEEIAILRFFLDNNLRIERNV